MQHDLLERHKGEREPDHLSVVHAIHGILLAAALAMIGGGCGPFVETSSVAMVSGRDDHGQLQRNAIGLQRSPTDSQIVATVEDGTFVRVTSRDGPWAHVVTADRAGEGWIQDMYLRGEAVRLEPSPQRVTFLDLQTRDGAIFVRVRFANGGTEEWVPAASLREVGAR